jgi:hypothetical protein
MDLQRILGFRSYRTAWIWLHKLHAALARPSAIHSALSSRSTWPSSGEKTAQENSFWRPPRPAEGSQPIARYCILLDFYCMLYTLSDGCSGGGATNEAKEVSIPESVSAARS